MAMSRESAETLALQVLGWLASNDELCPIFLGSSGASKEDLRAGARDPAFLGAVLDFVMMDDAWVIACCDAVGLAYSDPMTARQMLPGGGDVHWT